MRFRLVLNMLLFVLVMVSARSSRCDVLHGTATIHPYFMAGCHCGWNEAFDFSAQAIVPKTSESANLAFSEQPQDGQSVWSAVHANAFFYVPAAIETMLMVPETGTVYIRIESTGTYVMKTEENLFVKFTVRADAGTDITIEYFVQTDGSRYFGPVPTKPSTWGSVKALYR